MNLSIPDLLVAAGAEDVGGGKVYAPSTPEFASALATAAVAAVGGPWTPGQPAIPPVTLTGAGPVWAYLIVAHALHGLVPSLQYAAPSASITIYKHGGEA